MMSRATLLFVAAIAALSACKGAADGAGPTEGSETSPETAAPTGGAGPGPAPAPCGPDERRFAELGVCGKPSADGCFIAALSGDIAVDAPAGAVSFTLTNQSGKTLYLKIDPTSSQPEFKVTTTDGGEMSMAEARFCANWCSERGPVMEVDCGKPDDAMTELPPGGTINARWSGEIALDAAKSCDDGPARHCLKKQGAPAGAYRVEVCAFADFAGGQAPDLDGRVALATPAGEAMCVEAAFDAPVTGAVAVAFR